MRFIVILVFSSIACSTFSQVDAEINVFKDKDTNSTENIYYTDLTDKLLLKFTNSFKFTKLDITNSNTKETVKLAPALTLDLGVAFNYKWFGLGIALALPSGAHSDSIKGKTTKFDLQLNIYSKKFVVDALYQRYKGFHFANPGMFTNWDSTAIMPQLPDMENYSLGASAYYILNHKKFSYRAAYVRNVVQNKSAGSLLVGPFLNIDGASTKNGFIPKSLPIEVQDTFDIGFFRSTSYGLAIGYTYSVVIVKKVFMNFSLVPGIGIKDLETDFKGEFRASKKGVAARVAYRFAFGYEHRAFMLGLTMYGTNGNIVIDNFEFRPGAGMLKLFVAKRFDIKKKK
jgi:hypothetical protein